MRTKRVIKKTKIAKIRPVEPEVLEPVENELYSTIRGILAKARASAYVAVNSAMVEAYWNVGREIVEKQGGKRHAKYGDALVKTLASRLTADFGAGFTAANLFNMRQFYLAFPNFYTLCRELSWSHYRLLMRIEDEKARQYYLDECVKSHWSVRLLQRQIDTQFYQRLMRNRIDPKSLKALVKRDSAAVKDIIRSPAILEFSGITAAHYQEMRDEGLEVHLAAEPRQFKTTRLLLEQRIAYYVGDVNRTRPAFVNLDEPFAIDRCAVLILEMLQTLLTP